MSEQTEDRLNRLKLMADTRPDQHADSYMMALLEREKIGDLPENHVQSLATLKGEEDI